jgi:hypothetical protein
VKKLVERLGRELRLVGVDTEESTMAKIGTDTRNQLPAKELRCFARLAGLASLAFVADLDPKFALSSFLQIFVGEWA